MVLNKSFRVFRRWRPCRSVLLESKSISSEALLFESDTIAILSEFGERFFCSSRDLMNCVSCLGSSYGNRSHSPWVQPVRLCIRMPGSPGLPWGLQKVFACHGVNCSVRGRWRFRLLLCLTCCNPLALPLLSLLSLSSFLLLPPFCSHLLHRRWTT